MGEWIDVHYQQVETPGDYVIGYTYVEEWVEYTVDIEEGVYDIELYYSSESDDGIDGQLTLSLSGGKIARRL